MPQHLLQDVLGDDGLLLGLQHHPLALLPLVPGHEAGKAIQLVKQRSHEIGELRGHHDLDLELLLVLLLAVSWSDPVGGRQDAHHVHQVPDLLFKQLSFFDFNFL